MSKTKNTVTEADTQNFNAGEIINGDKAYISSAQIIQTKTGTGPWDSNDEPGNDSSEDNNIVRSFDQITYTVDLTMSLKKGITDTSLKGGVINVEAVLPENCANVVTWDLESMGWLEGTGKISNDGRVLTGKYVMTNKEYTIPGKQTLVLILKVEGAQNKTNIKPEFKFWLEGNENNDKYIINNIQEAIVSAVPRYNVELLRNIELAKEITLNENGNSQKGRLYGYSLTYQLYNNGGTNKGLKGIEYPDGDIKLDINLKLEKISIDNPNDVTDITDSSTPILYNYKMNTYDPYSTNVNGFIPNRNMAVSRHAAHDWRIPAASGGKTTACYDSGIVKMNQSGATIGSVLSDYKFNGEFPTEFAGKDGSVTNIRYTEDIGCFSTVYFQILVPYTEESSERGYNYYLTVTDANMEAYSNAGTKLENQTIKTDDSSRIQHVIFKQGGYGTYHWLHTDFTGREELYSHFFQGDAKSEIGQKFVYRFDITSDSNNDAKDDIYDANSLLKFDGEVFKITQINGKTYNYSGSSTNNFGHSDMKFKMLYAAKKDGNNWISDSEMKNTTEDELIFFKTEEEIKRQLGDKACCVGVLFESISGIAKAGTGYQVSIALETTSSGKIGTVYQFVTSSKLYKKDQKLDRTTQTKENPNAKFPLPDVSFNLNYIKTAYDENGNIIAGTHNGSYQYGQSLLIVGGKLSVLHSIEDRTTTGNEKINYDIGRNEDIVTFGIKPRLQTVLTIGIPMNNITITLEETLPVGLKYIPGSSSDNEPIVETLSGGMQKLTWYIYGCTVGNDIEKITYQAKIDAETSNGIQYKASVLVSADKIGTSSINTRTDSDTIQITNLASHRLYKETENPIIEKGENVEYSISYKNNTEEVINEFQLLDILPYNGDGRGTKYNGMYVLENIELTGQTGLKIYTTTDEVVKNITAKDENIGKSPMWKEVTAGYIGEEVKAIAVKGAVNGKNNVDIKLTLKPQGNTSKDIYINNVTAQTNKISEVMTSTNVKVQVVSRAIKGKIWEDSNRNGVIDSSEKYLEGTTVKLLNNYNNSEMTRTTTNEQGEYEFANLAKGTYKVEVEIDNLHELTEKEIGTNREINSKFNQLSKQTDEITKLNTISSPDIIEENVNAGIRKIQYNITTKVEGIGGNISGEGKTPYESVDKGENSVEDIIITPNEGYRVDKITVNGKDIEFVEEQNHTVILNKFTNMQENKEIVVTFKDVKTSVLVHHYKENTTEKLSRDVTIDGEVGEKYTTQVATDIPQNYELVAEPANKNGTMTEDQIVVTYYYRLKTPSITNQVINKTGTDRITITNQEMNYTVTYRTNVVDYIGNAEVTIIDTLPYAIDEVKSDLAGGIYDSNAQTITWKENVQNINSFADGGVAASDSTSTTETKAVVNDGTVEVTKTFKVVYVGLDMNQEKVVNNVSGNIKLLTPEKTSEEVIGSQESTIYKAIISSEKLVDKQEAIEGEKVTYTVRIKNEGNLAKTVTLRDTLPAGLTFDKNTLIQVGNLGTVYTEQNLKNGIPVEVPAKGTVDVKFAGIVDTLANDVFSKALENQATIDNELTNKVTTNVTKPNILAHKESTPSSGNKVLEGDEITYKIKVRNDGTREGRVTVKDTIPAGTTFVEGSVKIDEVASEGKTAKDLANGINLTVGVGQEKVLEFKVTVNKLADGTKIKNTAYINQNGSDKKVSEEPEHTYVEPKAEQNITKTGTAKIESLDQEITYNIAYTARILDYKGNAKVVLVDKLPYTIDKAKSDLAGGIYSAENNTITWEVPVENIQLTETKEVTVNKTIKVVYTGINKDVTSVKNTVTGHIEYETPTRTSEDVTANHTTTTGFTINIPVSKVWEDDSNKLNQRPTRVVFKLTGSDGSEYVKEMAKPGTAGSRTTQDQANPNKWNDIFENLPKYDVNNKEIVYTLTEEEKTEGDLRYYDSVVYNGASSSRETNEDGEETVNTASSTQTETRIVTNTNKYGKVTVHHYIMNTDGSTTTTKVPDTTGKTVDDVVIEGKVSDKYKTESAKNINEKYELVAEKLPGNATGTIEKYNADKPQEVIYYYKLKPAKVIINYLEKDEDTDDSNNQVLENKAELNGYVDEKYNTNTAHRKETIEKEGKTYTLVSNSGNTEGTMTLQNISVTYYYLQNSKATVRYVERNHETGEIVKDLEEPTVKEGLVGDEFVTNAKNFLGYRLVESPEKTTINLSKEEQTLIYYYEPVYSGLVENHIDEITGKLLETEVHDVQVGTEYNIPSKNFEGYDVVETKLPENATGTMGEELITVNYYYIKKAVLEVNYIDVLTNTPLTEQIVDNTKHEGDKYTTTAMEFENYDLVEIPSNVEGTMVVETDETGKITNNKTVVTYYYAKKSAGVEEHHIDIKTNKEIEEPILHEGHIGDEYDIKAKDFLSYKLVEKDEEGNSKLPENAKGTMTEEKIVVNYYYNQPAKVVVHYVEKETGKELEEKNQETGELQQALVIIEGQKDDDYTTTAKEFEYYTLIATELPQNAEGKMKVEIVENEKGEKVVNNTVDVYYYYQAKSFNIGVEKEITGIVVNGERKEITNGKLEKVEIYRKKTEETSVQIEYKIKVRNTGEIAGTTTIEENLPEGMKLANNDGMWEEQDGKLIKVIPEIGAGETKEYTVLLNWEQTGENMGEKANEVKLVETGNVPGFVDNNDKDNTSKANVIISVETGEGIPVVLLIALVGLVGLETVTLRYAVVLTKKQKK